MVQTVTGNLLEEQTAVWFYTREDLKWDAPMERHLKS
jgi:hypothetical protein